MILQIIPLQELQIPIPMAPLVRELQMLHVHACLLQEPYSEFIIRKRDSLLRLFVNSIGYPGEIFESPHKSHCKTRSVLSSPKGYTLSSNRALSLNGMQSHQANKITTQLTLPV